MSNDVIVPLSHPVFRDDLTRLPPYLKKTNRLEAMVPWPYLKSVSTNDFYATLKALFEDSVRGLSASTNSHLKKV